MYGRLKTVLFSKSNRIEELEKEVEEYAQLTRKQSDLLTAAVNVLKGPPPNCVLWSHHDIADLCKDLILTKISLEKSIYNYEEVIEDVVQSGGTMDYETELRARVLLDLPPPKRD